MKGNALQVRQQLKVFSAAHPLFWFNPWIAAKGDVVKFQGADALVVAAGNPAP